MDNDYENTIRTIKIADINILDNIHVTKILNMNKKEIQMSSNQFISQMYEDTIGNSFIMKSPFGYDNYLVYCDYTASGRGLTSLEHFINDKVLTSYANLHSTVGFCSEQTSHLSTQVYKQVCKVDTTCGQADNWHEYVVNQ